MFLIMDLLFFDGVILMIMILLEWFSSIFVLILVMMLEFEVVMVFMKDLCDVGIDVVEDCWISMDCDKVVGMYLICENGICRCIVIVCLVDM